MKNIIVPIDYSEASINAASYAAALGQFSGAKIILFHAFHLPIHASGMPFLFPDIDEIIVEHKQKLNGIGTELSKKYGVKVISISRPSFVLDEIELLVRQYKADLVVMGMRGSSLDYKVFGSITVAAVRQGNFPLLIIPMHITFSPIKKILFACEYACLPPDNKLQPLKKIASRFNSSVQVLHVERLVPVTVGNGKRSATANLENILDGIHHEYKYLYDEKAVQGIERGIMEFNPDILAMVPHKLGFWDELLNKGTTDKLAYQGSLPLLAMPNPDMAG